MHTGSPELIEIEIDARGADYVKEREWHRSQEIVERADGSLLLRLCVCNDLPLRSWIHSLGPMARVVSPLGLVQQIVEELQEARDKYMPLLKLDMVRMTIPTSRKAIHPPRTRRATAS